MKDIMTKSNVEERRVLVLKTGQELQGRNLEAGTEAEAMEEHCLLVCSPWLTPSAFLYNPGLSVQSWHCPKSLIKKMFHSLAYKPIR